MKRRKKKNWSEINAIINLTNIILRNKTEGTIQGTNQEDFKNKTEQRLTLEEQM